jgi:hypothetical protein
LAAVVPHPLGIDPGVLVDGDQGCLAIRSPRMRRAGSTPVGKGLRSRQPTASGELRLSGLGVGARAAGGRASGGLYGRTDRCHPLGEAPEGGLTLDVGDELRDAPLVFRSGQVLPGGERREVDRVRRGVAQPFEGEAPAPIGVFAGTVEPIGVR